MPTGTFRPGELIEVAAARILLERTGIVGVRGYEASVPLSTARWFGFDRWHCDTAPSHMNGSSVARRPSPTAMQAATLRQSRLRPLAPSRGGNRASWALCRAGNLPRSTAQRPRRPLHSPHGRPAQTSSCSYGTALVFFSQRGGGNWTSTPCITHAFTFHAARATLQTTSRTTGRWWTQQSAHSPVKLVCTRALPDSYRRAPCL